VLVYAHGEVGKVNKNKLLGVVYTPEKIARFLVRWAIRTNADLVLDPGAGKGVFVFEAIKRLTELGCPESKALDQIFAVEYDKTAFEQLKRHIEKEYAKQPDRNIITANFFDVWPGAGSIVLPTVDAVVGNPPYVERQLAENADKIRSLLSASHPDLKLNRSTDIYGYFIIHAADFLKPNGRLAFIVSDTWMSMDFGVAIRDFLLKHFRIKAIIGFDKRVFPKVLVRAVMILLEKRAEGGEPYDNQVAFMRLSDLDLLDRLEGDLYPGKEIDNEGPRVALIQQSKLDQFIPWTIYLKSPEVYLKAISHPRMTKLSELARVNIGVQTLKRDFFIIKESERRRRGLENRFFEKIILSPRGTGIVVDSRKKVTDVVLYCDREKEDLLGTRVLLYIQQAEKTEISPRGKGETYVGLQNIPRIKKAHRKPWYNIRAEIDRRCKGPILIPRRIYERYAVVWNKLMLPANEDFIVVEPKDSRWIVPLLAILNSSLTEFFARVVGHMYGGGVCDLRPDDVKNLPVLDLNTLTDSDYVNLQEAYATFLSSNGTDRRKIDEAIQSILNLPEKLQRDISRDYKEILEVSLLTKRTI